MARIVLAVGDGRRIGDGDSYDGHHYASARYANVLVTDDGGFRDTCALIGTPEPTVVTFEAFIAAEFGGSGAQRS